jgi:hypothetical protein
MRSLKSLRNNVVLISFFLPINGFCQNTNYYVLAGMEGQQFNYGGATNYTNFVSGGINIFDRFFIDMGFCYHYRYRPSTNSEADKLRWSGLKVEASADILNKAFTPGISVSFQKGLQVRDYEKNVIIDGSNIKPGLYYTNFPIYAPDPDFGYLIRKMNYELQGSVYIRYTTNRVSARIFSGILTRRFTLYALHSEKEVFVYPVMWNIGASLGVFIGKS